MLITIILFIIGLILIIKGGDIFVDKSTWIAETFHIPKFIIGATIVSIATTLPELLVSTIATYMGNPTIAVGNAVGSVTANTAMIMSIAIICMNIIFNDREYWFGLLCLLCSTSILLLVSHDGYVTNIGSVLLFGVVCLFLINNISVSKSNSMGMTNQKSLPAVIMPKPTKWEINKNAIFFILSAIAVAVGSRLLVTSGTEIAQTLGVSERIIAITLIAIGTSLPELVTTLTAISKKQASLSVGNIIGANIIDISLILPLCSIISGHVTGEALMFDAKSELVDIPICFIFILIACLPPLFRKRFYKWQGWLMLVLYIVYIVASILDVF